MNQNLDCCLQAAGPRAVLLVPSNRPLPPPAIPGIRDRSRAPASPSSARPGARTTPRGFAAKMETMADDQLANLLVSNCTVPGKQGVMANLMAHQTGRSVSRPRREAFHQQCCDVDATEEAEETGKSWEDIPYDIAHHVLRRLGSLADSIPFANVCRNWSAAARSCPMFPRLTLPDGGFFSVPDNAAERLFLAPDTAAARCCGSFGGGWLVLVRDCRSVRRDRARRVSPRRGCSSVTCCCFMVNLFSKATVPLPELAAMHHEIEASVFINKIVATKAPDDARCIFAVMIQGEDQEITFCRPGKGSCQAELDDNILDMVFFKGKLYALTQGEGLFVLRLDEDGEGRPVICTVEQMIADSQYPSFPILDIWSSPTIEARYLRHYLVVSRRQLLMVRRWLYDPHAGYSDGGDRTLSFEVLALNSESSEWVELKCLDGEALLVSKRGSVSVASLSCHGARADCIYFVCDAMATVEDPFHDSGVYSLKDGTMTVGLKTVMKIPDRPRRGRWFPTWLSHVEKQ
ncbi:uncharacterized protein LOC133900563 isoform X2 [Phragmites australis]|uniref:uncharacterized protein LOC133900563 isoform X2 n=1 Tax=Phragmites australis TaxID=29695 RepID=UPI002D76A43E|nr:uncharacterized protein LOC133900563 isoform X2 [Phragmites australis]